MEKRGDIVPGHTPPEAVACKKRVEDFKQRLFPFVAKIAAEKTVESQVDELDADFRNAAAKTASAALK